MINEELIQIALSQYGIQEWAGEDHNPEVLKYFDEIGQQWVDDDETAWCSAYVNWVAMKAMCERSNKLDARSWLDIGIDYYIPNSIDPVESTPFPAMGDILIFWREKKSSWKGHVGFYINKDDTYYYVLGGNQNNRVCIKKYPKSRLLGIRRLRKITDMVNE